MARVGRNLPRRLFTVAPDRLLISAVVTASGNFGSACRDYKVEGLPEKKLEEGVDVWRCGLIRSGGAHQTRRIVSRQWAPARF